MIDSAAIPLLFPPPIPIYSLARVGMLLSILNYLLHDNAIPDGVYNCCLDFEAYIFEYNDF